MSRRASTVLQAPPASSTRGETTQDAPARSRTRSPTRSTKKPSRTGQSPKGKRTSGRKPPKRGTKSNRKPPSGPPRRWWKLKLALVLLVAACAAVAWLIWPVYRLSGQLGADPHHQPSRVYAHPLTLRIGDAWTPETITAHLDQLGYLRTSAAPTKPGTYRTGSDQVEIYRRRFPSPRGRVGGNRLRLTFSGGRIRGLAIEGRADDDAWLDPPLVASYYGPDLQERRPFDSVKEDLPEDLILSVLAIEDSRFLTHVGISFIGALRAAWTNLLESEVRQGGSTLTQQLVKNLFLTHERTWTRKIREAVLAVYLEIKYDKQQIFRAYLNEIYWGRSGSVDLMGVGAAAWAYFGKEPAQLTLAESALLAGIIKSPAQYSPIKSPERARERRNVVLERLAQLNWVSRERLEAAVREPVVTRQGPLMAKRAPYFADALADEAQRRFGLSNLRDKGYTIISTLSVGDQHAAEKAVLQGLPEVESKWQKGAEDLLQAALISVDPRTGGILAYVGGRDYGLSQFDRVALARRQPGSAFKPVVYAAAFNEHQATPATVLDDSPFSRRYGGRLWSPKNSDGKYHGPVSARHALERSLNVPTAKLALSTGLDPVIRLAHDMGIQGRISPYPALALGTMEATPLEMATVYATFAAGGMRPALHGIDAVFDGAGRRVEGKPLAAPQRVLDEDVAFLVSHVLQGVLTRGTGRGARGQGVSDALAGKTGTTNSRRDSWFAGYSPERATLVWVGYDDASTTRLSGARAALPIWARFVRAVRPPGGYSSFRQTPGIVSARIDPATGGLATTRCPQAEIVTEHFLREFPPGELCGLHSGRRARGVAQPDGIEAEKPGKKHQFRNWLDMVRGDEEPD